MTEKAIKFGRFNSLVGVITEPPQPLQTSSLGVIFVNAGLIHRIGPNRIYVKIARKLADQGTVVLRFDLSGVGDSTPRPDLMPVEEFTIDDVKQAMDALSAAYGCQRFLLMGHCAGAYHSFRTAACDPRVRGVVMINPDGGEADWVDYDRKRKTAQYYENYYAKAALGDRQRWKRFFTGQVNYKEVVKSVLLNVVWSRVSGIAFRAKQRFSKPTAPNENTGKLFTIEEILNRLFDLDLQVLMVYSENSTSQQRVEIVMGKAMEKLKAAGKLSVEGIPGADHIFTTLASQQDLGSRILDWQAQFFQPAPSERV